MIGNKPSGNPKLQKHEALLQEDENRSRSKKSSAIKPKIFHSPNSAKTVKNVFMQTYTLNPGHLILNELREIRSQPIQISLPDSAWEPIKRSHQHLIAVVQRGTPAYGINTGFGKLAKTQVDVNDLSTLQHNLIRSHAAGVGTPIDLQVVRLAMILKLLSLAQGYSGVRPKIIEYFMAMLSHDIVPVVPEKGSVGASGDLAPLAHLSLPLIGEGEVFLNETRMPAAKALQIVGLTPLVLEAKEGLALLNGTQISTALAIDGLFSAEQNLASAIVIGSITVDATLGSYVPFDQRIHEVRRQSGQSRVASLYRTLLNDSQLNQSHANCDRVQDPYSLRCQPQVLGACLDQLDHGAKILLREANAVSDNPLICPETGEVLSGGNFHAEPVAMVADNIALAISETGSLSERRIAMLIDSSISELPPFLTTKAGLESGFMVAHVTAAALASENKSLSHPASVDSLPTSANQEDHVSMATFAARRLRAMNENTQNILAIEYLAASQGISLRRPLTSSSCVETAVKKLRQQIPEYQEDRVFYPDIDTASSLISHGELATLLPTQPLDTVVDAS
ncbi:MAG: histidine ammonia-lyase [Arenicellales bacterium]|nr:histidine ammonia-lyase [Arenicellales bacterium]